MTKREENNVRRHNILVTLLPEGEKRECKTQIWDMWTHKNNYEFLKTDIIIHRFKKPKKSKSDI